MFPTESPVDVTYVVLAVLVPVAHLGLEDAVHAVAVEGAGAPPLVVPGAARVTSTRV